MDVSSFAAQSNKIAMTTSPTAPAHVSQFTSQLATSQLTTSQFSVLQATSPQLTPQYPDDAAKLENTARLRTSDPTAAPVASEELRKAFEDFVGQTFFAEMIKACRSGQQPSAYFHGGRAEEIFQGQLDQVLSEELSESSASKIADPMFELFMLKRQS